MLYPSIDRLKEKLDSKYILVAVAAKRAREMRDHRNIVIERPVSSKHVGMALEEIEHGILQYERTQPLAEDDTE